MSRTEMRNENTMSIHKESTEGIMRLIANENFNAAKAVEAAVPDIVKAADALEKGMKQGGRLIYVGAGTSGRLGVIDAVECPPTYGVSPDLVIGLIAGGRERMFSAGEGEEDNGQSGINDLKACNLVPQDTVVGVSAAGNAAYVADALKYAREIGCATIGITNNYGSRLALESEFPIVLDTGAEVITGSTRMKAGSAQKMVMNMLSTCVMIKLGHVYENMMVNLRPFNIKLKQRMISIVSDIVPCTREEAEKYLDENEWSIQQVIKTLGI